MRVGTHQTITVSLPRTVVKEVERVRRLENCSRSNVIGEALRRYLLHRFPAVRATKADLAAMRRARAEIKAGKFVTLDQLLHGLDTPDRKASGKRTPKNTR